MLKLAIVLSRLTFPDLNSHWIPMEAQIIRVRVQATEACDTCI